MSEVMEEVPRAFEYTALDQSGSSQLLQLPETALNLVLQQLDPCSLASMAVSCSRLEHVLIAHSSQVKVRISSKQVLDSCVSWVEHNSSSLSGLTECIFINTFVEEDAYITGRQLRLTHLPCPQLRRLELRGLHVQLEPVCGCPGVLQGCPGLTALVLWVCKLGPMRAPCAAIAALPELQDLRVLVDRMSQPRPEYPEFQHPLKLTHLSFRFQGPEAPTFRQFEQLSQLSALTNLQHLELSHLPRRESPCWPSQLVKLTCLRADYEEWLYTIAEQFQHLSCFTALQELAITCASDRATIPGIQHLAQLTRLKLDVGTRSGYHFGLEFSTAITNSWACRTALLNLSLAKCEVQPAALAALTQLRALSLNQVKPTGAASLQDLLRVLSELTRLTDISWRQAKTLNDAAPLAITPAAAFTALTASTNLCSLELLWDIHAARDPLQHALQLGAVSWGPVLFQPGIVYPRLRRIWVRPELLCDDSQPQLQLLCSCCPALESLTCDLMPATRPSPTASLPLLQLSALTQLRLYRVGEAAAAAVIGVAAQLTGLRHLEMLWTSPKLDGPTVLQLTALAALEKLYLRPDGETVVHMNSKAPRNQPPDVWKQLLRELLRDAACRRELLKHSSGAAAAPAELMLAQLAATLAEELAASLPDSG